MYKVIGSIKSRTLRVLWMLEELGQTYDHDPAAPQSDAARAANPSGKVPTLIVDGVAITDSVAIITYLADRHGALTAPAGTIDRARQDAMTCFIVDEIEGPLWTARAPHVHPARRAPYAGNQRQPALGIRTKRENAGATDGRRPVPDGSDDERARHTAGPLPAMGAGRKFSARWADAADLSGADDRATGFFTRGLALTPG